MAFDLQLGTMSLQDIAPLRHTWEQIARSLSDLLSLGRQKQSRIAFSALDVQRQRLQLWAEIIGLANNQVDDHLNYDHLNLPKMREILQHIHQHVTSATVSDGPESSVIWSSSAALEAFTEKFNIFQRRLQPFLGDNQRSEFRKITRETALGLLCADSPSEFEEMEAVCKIFSGKSTGDSQELLRLIQSRRRFLDIVTADQAPSSPKTFQRSRAYVKQSKNLTNIWDERKERTIGVWTGGQKRHVYVEWKSITSEKSMERRDIIYDRVQNLADVLSSDAGLNVLPFLAIIQPNDDQWGFVYELPKPTQIESTTQEMPNTLRDLLGHGENFAPSLSDRVRLALQLADSLLNFHSIGWLHKNVRSENVMFFPKNLSQRTLNRPRWVGLTYARGDTENDEKVSERTAWDELYCHPKYKQNPQQRFRKEYDYYALGALLLEIGQWKTLDKICGSQIRWVPGANASLLEAIANKSNGRTLLQRLRYHTGDIYHDAVKTCLTGDFGVAEDAPAKDWHLAFFREVVHRLESCAV